MRRFLVPVGLIVMAVALGVLLFGVPEAATTQPTSSVLTAANTTSSTASLADGAQLFAENREGGLQNLLYGERFHAAAFAYSSYEIFDLHIILRASLADY